MNCQERLDLLKGGGHPAVGGAPWAACTVQPHPKSCVLCSVLKMPSSYLEMYSEDIQDLLGADTKQKLKVRKAQWVFMKCFNSLRWVLS